jgi:putative flippase GtrA
MSVSPHSSSEARTSPVVPPVVVQWLRFAAVGGSNTLLSWCLYAVLVRLGVHYLLGSGLAFGVGALNSYGLNRRWTFRSRDRRLPEAVRFGLVQCVGLAFDVGLLYALVHHVGVHHLIAQALVFPAASAVTFLLSRHWAFAGAKTAMPTGGGGDAP